MLPPIQRPVALHPQAYPGYPYDHHRPRSHQHAYHPYSARPHYQPVKQHPSPRRRQAPLLPPIETLSRPSLNDSPPPLTRNSRPRTIGRSSSRHSDLQRYSYSSSNYDESPSYPYASPQSVGRPHSANRIKQEPIEHVPYYRRYDDDLPLTPISAHFDSPAMAPIDPRDRALERLPHLRISDRDFDEPAEYRAMSPAERRFLQTMPVQHPRPIMAYPVQTDAMNIDPALAAPESAAVETPEIRVQPETLAAAEPMEQQQTSEVAKQESLSAPDSDIKKDTPFSRSPELRVSHKLAERKRRKEMRDLFDELREALPADRGMKASKWEILSKAVDYINHLKNQVSDAQRTVELLHRDLAAARGENPAAWPPSYPHFAAAISQYVPPHTGTSTPAAAAATTAAAPAATPAAPAVTAAAPAAVPAAAPAADAAVAPAAAPAAVPAAQPAPAKAA